MSLLKMATSISYGIVPIKPDYISQARWHAMVRSAIDYVDFQRNNIGPMGF